MFAELLSLKQDLLQNQQMIRSELAMHKQQIDQQIASVSQQKEQRASAQRHDTATAPSFHDEMNKYHDKISSEIESLRKAIALQNESVSTKLTKPSPSPPRRLRSQQNEEVFHVVQPRFIPPTPLLPDTAGSEQEASRISTGFTAFGVDQYLLAECKRNNEYLQCPSRDSTRCHTPNIYRIDRVDVDSMDRVRDRVVEKSIRSKSDFLYNVQAAKEAEEHLVGDDGGHRSDHRSDSEDEGSRRRMLDEMERIKTAESRPGGDEVVNEVMTRNENRLHYFRSTTPLDATRSMKIGLQKIEDLLAETEQLKIKSSRSRLRGDGQRESAFDMDFDDSLYRLV